MCSRINNIKYNILFLNCLAFSYIFINFFRLKHKLIVGSQNLYPHHERTLRKEYGMKKIIVTVGAVTYAIKARRLLKNSGVPSRLVKVSSERSLGGCTHGIEISEEDLYTAASVLRGNGISYTIYSDNI